MREVRIGILPGQRVLIAGRTGSGKTHFARWLARQMSGGIVLDPKADDAWLDLPGAVVVPGYEIPEDLASPDPERRIRWAILRPPPGELSEMAMAFDGVLADVIARWHDLTVVVDELYTLHISGRPGPGLTGILTRGRSRGISAIMCTQRPRWISRFTLSEADALAVFALTLPADRKPFYELSGKKIFLKMLPPREFLWYIVSSDFVARCAPIEDS